MDFHSLSRRDLQALCKRNRIPANITNVAMADALQALQVVEGMGEIQELLQFQSPKKPVARSPDLPRTGRRTSARRAPVREEPKDQQASPLPRARRVTAKASEIMTIVTEGEEEGKQEGPEDKSKTPATCRAPKTRALSTTRRACKKDEEGGEKQGEENREGSMEILEIPEASHGRKTRCLETLNARKRATKEEGGELEAPAGIPSTPATRNGCRTSVRRMLKEGGELEAPARIPSTPDTRNGCRASVRRMAQTTAVKAKAEKASEIVKTYRRTRQSSRNQAEGTVMDVSANAGKKSTRDKKAVMMGALDQEREEQEGEDVTGAKKDSDELQMEAMKTLDLPGATTSDLCARDSGAKMEGPGATSSAASGVEASKQGPKSGPETAEFSVGQIMEGFQECQTIQEPLDSTPEEENQEFKVEESGGDREPAMEGHDPRGEKKGENQEQDSPIKGLVCSGHSQEKDLAQDSAQQNPCIEITKGGGSDGEEEETGGGTDLDFYQQEPLFSDEIPAEIEDFSGHSPVRQTPGDSSSPQANRSQSENLGSDGSGDLITKDEGMKLDLLLTGEVAEESGVDLPANHSPETETKSGDDDTIADSLVAALAESKESVSSPPSQQVFVPDPSSDIGSLATETCEVVDLLLDDERCHDLVCEILPESKEFGGEGPIYGLTQPEHESILDAAACPLLQIHSPEQSMLLILEDGRSPAKSLAQVDDLTGENRLSTKGSFFVGNQTPPEPQSILKSTSSPLLQAHSPDPSVQRSDAGGSPAKLMSSELGTGDPSSWIPSEGFNKAYGSGLEEGNEKRSAARRRVSVGIYRDGGEGHQDEDKENKGANGLTLLTVGGEAKAKDTAEQQMQPRTDLKELSLRKLKAIYREELEGKRRTALTALNDNRV